MGLVDMSRVDLANRDPTDINEHLRVQFEDVLAEPAGTHSIDCVWLLSYRCFTGTKLCCYRCLTLFCAWWIAMIWGFEFACLSFYHIWLITPHLRYYAINCGAAQKYWGICVQCFLAPICETCGLFFSRIRMGNIIQQD